MADNFKRDKFGYRHQPGAYQGAVGNPAAFNPDVVIVIKVESKTGATSIESGNNVPLNPLNVASICLSVSKANLDTYVKQVTSNLAKGIAIPPAERTATNPPHNFVKGVVDNVCSYCGEVDTKHTSESHGSN